MKTPYSVWKQYCVPHHAFSAFGGLLSQSQIPWLKNYLIQWFLKRYPVNLSEALQPDPSAYPSYHEFFIRKLKANARPVDHTPTHFCSPCDATISQIGQIDNSALIQAKDQTYSVGALLGNAEEAALFSKGSYATLYLAPIDYHRVHMPFSGTLQSLRYIPGRLFSVNPITTRHIDNLFTRNERVVAVFKNEETQRHFALVLVGAMIVGNIYTNFNGKIPHRSKNIRTIDPSTLPETLCHLEKGEEMGYFSLGSTVIVLTEDAIQWEKEVKINSKLKFGESMGKF